MANHPSNLAIGAYGGDVSMVCVGGAFNVNGANSINLKSNTTVSGDLNFTGNLLHNGVAFSNIAVFG